MPRHIRLDISPATATQVEICERHGLAPQRPTDRVLCVGHIARETPTQWVVVSESPAGSGLKTYAMRFRKSDCEAVGGTRGYRKYVRPLALAAEKGASE